jgi:DNA-binding NarL/FixJ family response regulator
MIRVLIADDQALVRAGLRMLLESEVDFAIAGEAANGTEAVALATHSHPDVVLMDIRMPGLDGLEATRQIAADPMLDAVKVVILTTFESDQYVFEALRGGASGFLVKDTEPVDLLNAVRVVAAGNALLSPTVTRRLIAEFAAQPPRSPIDTPQLVELTDRERQVVALVGRGLSNTEIAEQLTVSPATAKTHVSRAMIKVGARDRAQLVVFAYEVGLVRAGRQ